jgi:hypothetical protein
MLSLQAIAWHEVRFVSIEDTNVRVVIGEKVHSFNFGSRAEMEEELHKWFSRDGTAGPKFSSKGRALFA